VSPNGTDKAAVILLVYPHDTPEVSLDGKTMPGTSNTSGSKAESRLGKQDFV
jgi:hypothetical protein